MVIVCPLVYIWGFYICMHTTMANLNYEKDGKVFLKCKECGEFKEVNIENWYRHSEGFLWVLWRCKECIKKWRKTEYERWMAREREIGLDIKMMIEGERCCDYIIKKEKKDIYWRMNYGN